MYDLLQNFPIPSGPIVTPTMSLVTQNRQNNATTTNNSNTSSNNELISND